MGDAPTLELLCPGCNVDVVAEGGPHRFLQRCMACRGTFEVSVPYGSKVGGRHADEGVTTSSYLPPDQWDGALVSIVSEQPIHKEPLGPYRGEKESPRSTFRYTTKEGNEEWTHWFLVAIVSFCLGVAFVLRGVFWGAFDLLFFSAFLLLPVGAYASWHHRTLARLKVVCVVDEETIAMRWEPGGELLRKMSVRRDEVQRIDVVHDGHTPNPHLQFTLRNREKVRWHLATMWNDEIHSLRIALDEFLWPPSS